MSALLLGPLLRKAGKGSSIVPHPAVPVTIRYDSVLDIRFKKRENVRFDLAMDEWEVVEQ